MRQSPGSRVVPRSRALAMAFVLGAAACADDSTAPRPTAELAIEIVNLRGPSVLLSGTSDADVRCDVRFRATATGSGSATFRDATFMFFAGVDRTTPVDVLEFSAQEVREAWAGGVLEPFGLTMQAFASAQVLLGTIVWNAIQLPAATVAGAWLYREGASEHDAAQLVLGGPLHPLR